MIFAGHTPQSAQLQASLGYGRVWYNCTSLMPAVACQAYLISVVPGCIGAGRMDRLARYTHRSLLLSLCTMIPFFVLQFLSGSIMRSLGVPPTNADDVNLYCRWMVIATVVNMLGMHLEQVMVNLGYARSSTFTSFLSGLGVQVTCSYFFILRWDWGILGAALAQIAVQSSRFLIWSLLMLYFGLFRLMCIPPPGSESLLNVVEARIFFNQMIPQLLSNLAGWLIFELQMMALANISGISQDAVAAGAVWVQFESSLAAAQDGWLKTTSMRSLVLLGKQDPGAREAFGIFNKLAAGAVLACNVLLLLGEGFLCSLVSNDLAVQQWFHKIVWVLVIHTQTRISALNCLFLFIPLGMGHLRVITTFVCFYCIATPLVGVIAMTDMVTQDIALKMVACVGATSIAQFVQALYCCRFIHRLDWKEAGNIIKQRANTDRATAPAAQARAPQAMELQGAQQEAA
eukprot:TRINITY_DN68924_c0_g1_i1.p1 TRINITY_DN68924_c0_g1~~TRINITY_DN68924_c0_g1_i1.p1  ORF type:complete len:528 (+),score=95.23 TRINITY_DN68924_c0_g1_i1:213-1586(+)